MKKIGLVTYYNSDNYGAMLQAYALQTEIRKNSCSCVIISHDRFSAQKKEFALQYVGKVSRVQKQIMTGLRYPGSLRIIAASQRKPIKRGKQLTRIKCAAFREEFFPCRTEVFYYTTDQIYKDPPICDGYVCGSDQIWNPERFTGAEPFYLDFAPEGRNRIAYAPSLAMTYIPDDMKQAYKELVSRFSDVSVREKNGCAAIEKATGITPEWVMDPTFLLTGDDWKKFSDVKIDIPERYLFCYFLGKENLIRSRTVINDAAKKLNAKVIVLPFGEHCADVGWIGMAGVGPREFVKLILNAKYIITDSFHAVSISILLQKDFSVYSGKDTSTYANRFDRIANLLEICALEDRTYTNMSDIFIEHIQYTTVNENLRPMIDRSKAFLRQALDKVEEHPQEKHLSPVLASYESCTGCSACYAVCLSNAISMSPDQAGFWRPVIDYGKCIHCGKCETSCPVRTPPQRNTENPDYCALYATGKEMRLRGSSGNAFGLFANAVIAEKGEVFGAALSEDCRQLSICGSSEVGLEKLQKSKYFEASMGKVFSQIKKDLDAGKRVLFTGTPCQAAGIRSVFGDHPGLIICDFICHGIASAKWYGMYLDEMERKYHAKARDVAFRSKAFGWRLYCMKIAFENGKQYIKSQSADPYFIDYFKNSHLRTNCYSCNRAIHSCADITFGDYWTANVKQNMEDTDEGISVVCLRTEKGKQFYADHISGRDDVFIKALTKDDIDETFVYRVRSVPKSNDVLPERFDMHPHLGMKGILRKIYYEYYVRPIKLHR